MKPITNSSTARELHWAVYALRDRLDDLIADARLIRKCLVPDGCDVCRAEGLLDDLGLPLPDGSPPRLAPTSAERVRKLQELADLWERDEDEAPDQLRIMGIRRNGEVCAKELRELLAAWM